MALWSVRRINTLASALKVQNYLEIGVCKGMTFTEVDILKKTAVDPKFQFDFSDVADENISFNEMTSDRFFSTLPLKTKFDLVFIDGLHTFEQTYRDFCNSLLHAHDKTVFLIDDTVPKDVFSSLRNQAKAIKWRGDAGLSGGAWHGDAFKTVFALHDFHLGLNYRTIVSPGDNPQTLVWRSNTGWRDPLFNSLEHISRLTYFDLLEHKNVLRECLEAEAINLCLQEVSEVSC